MKTHDIGMISPPKWFCYCDDELESLCLGDLRVMNTQLRLARDFRYDLVEIEAAQEELRSAARSLADSQVEMVAQIGTPFATVHGWQGAHDLEKRIADDIGMPFEMMGLSLPRIAKGLGIETATVCTVYYTREWTESYKTFLADSGLRALYAGSFSDLGILEQGTMLDSCLGHDSFPNQMMIDTVVRCCERAPEAEAVLLSGLPCPQLSILSELEAAVGRPVISYPAIYVRVLKQLGLSGDMSFGRMFSLTQ